MAFLSRARMRLRFPSQLLKQNHGISAEVYQEDLTSCGLITLEKQPNQNHCRSHAYLYTLTDKEDPLKGKSLNAEYTDMPCLLGVARMLKNKAIVEGATCAKGVQKSSCRWIQIHSETVCSHPWTRDRLAERMSILRERRFLLKRMMQERFSRRRWALSQDSLHLLETPLPSQPLEGVLQPRTSEDARVAPLLARTDLIITRNIEWANLLVGFEQENRYVIMDPRESLAVVGFITESSNWLSRQFLRSRRAFHAAIMDSAGGVLFTVRRPIWFINSTIYAEIDGKVVGFAKRRWHLWRRIYDVYLGKRQFAVVENPGFWNWTFTLKDENGRVLAEIDRHFRGFGYEMLTDAGQYALRFGDIAPHYHPPTTSHTLTADKTRPSQLQGINVNPELETEQFTSDRPLTLLERTITLALAISLDNDYFSRHRGFLPIPFFSDEQ